MFKNSSENGRNYVVFGSMYFVQGLNTALLATTLLYFLQGVMGGGGVVDKEEAGEFLFWIGIPWGLWKLLGGPLIDWMAQRSSSRKQAVNRIFALMLLATWLAAVSLFSMGTGEEVRGLMVLAFLASSAMAVQDLATDSLAIYTLRAKERGTAQGLMAICSYLGTLLGGSGMLYLMSQGWSWFEVASWSAALLLSFGVLLPFIFFTNPSNEGEEEEVVVQDFKWKRLGWLLRENFWAVVPIAAVFLALTAMICQGATANIVGPWLQNSLQFSKEQISDVVFYNGLFKIPGALLGMLLMRYLINEKGVALALILKVLAYAGLALSKDFWGDSQIMFAVILTTSVADGIFLVALRSYFMEVTNKATAATQFAVYMAVLNFGGDWTNLLGAELSKHYDSYGHLLVAAGLQLVAFLPLLVLWRKRRAV